MIGEHGINYEQILNLHSTILTAAKSCGILALNNGRGALCQEYTVLNGSSQELMHGKKGRVPRFCRGEGNAGTSDKICRTVATMLRRAILHRVVVLLCTILRR